MSSSQIFIISSDENNGIQMYNNLEKAKIELKKIYENTRDYKHYNYKIAVYNLNNENEYIISNIKYTYKFDIFSIHSV